jgi:hypothetical protein
MKIIITSWYIETVKEIINNEIDGFTPAKFVGGSKIKIEYKKDNEDLFLEYSSWLESAKSCQLIREYKIER